MRGTGLHAAPAAYPPGIRYAKVRSGILPAQPRWRRNNGSRTSTPLDAVRYPDILYLRRMREHHAPGALRAVVPVAAFCAADPCALERPGRQPLDFGASGSRTIVAPHRVDIGVRGEDAREFVCAAGNDIDHPIG